MTTNEPIALVICDDHRILTDTLAMLVERDPELRLPAPPAHRPEEAIALATEHQPGVVLMDIEFKGVEMSGIEATRAIKEASPNTRVVIMTAHGDDALLVDAVEAGASAFLTKSESAEEVLDAIKAAYQGEVLIDPDTFTRLLQQVARDRIEQQVARERMSELTEREFEVLELLAQGMRGEDVAATLDIKPVTVQTHVRNILYKLDVHSKLEAVVYAVRSSAITV